MTDRSIVSLQRRTALLSPSLSMTSGEGRQRPRGCRASAGALSPVERSSVSDRPAVVDPDLLVLDMRRYRELEDSIIQVKLFLENVCHLAKETGLYEDQGDDPSLFTSIIIGSDESGSPSQTLRNVLQRIFRNCKITFVETVTDDDELIMVVDALSGIQDDDDPPPVDTASEAFVPQDLIIPSSHGALPPSSGRYQRASAPLPDVVDDGERRRSSMPDGQPQHQQHGLHPLLEAQTEWVRGRRASPSVTPQDEWLGDQRSSQSRSRTLPLQGTFDYSAGNEDSDMFHARSDDLVGFDEEHLLDASRQSFLVEQRRRRQKDEEMHALASRQSVLDEQKRKREAEERYNRELERALRQSEHLALMQRQEEQRRLRSEEELVHQVIARTHAAAENVLRRDEEELVRMTMERSLTENRVVAD